MADIAEQVTTTTLFGLRRRTRFVRQGRIEPASLVFTLDRARIVRSVSEIADQLPGTGVISVFVYPDVL